MRKVGILYHPLKEPATLLSRKLEQLLSAKGVAVWVCSSWDTEQAAAALDGTELLLSVGGDGTILRVAQMAAARQIPVTGINLGRLGFMTELGADEALERLPELLGGKGWTDQRAMLEVRLGSGSGERTYHALNDAVVARGAVARMIYVETVISGEMLTNYHVDGVIVATATGSTGYALAALGTILYPRSKDFLLAPVMPHLAPDHGFVLPQDAELRLTVRTDSEAILTVDGYMTAPMPDGAAVSIRRSDRTVRFLRIHPDRYYATLENKLRGKH